MTKEETFLINVGGFFLACVSIVWLFGRFSFPIINELMTLPAWASLMVIFSLILSAVGKGKYAYGMFLGALLIGFLLFAVAASI